MDKQTVMMTFRTEVGLPKVGKHLTYRDKSLMIGSCFTENMGNYLQKHYFPVLTNPCGILYNTASMATCIEMLLNGKPIDEKELFFANELWNNFHFHSRFSNPDKQTALAAMNDSLQDASKQLRSASHLFLTFGTSWVFVEKESNSIVGNCHKLPAGRFTRCRLTVDEMAAQWIEIIDRLLVINPGISVILTISPIRHMKDGSYENQVSKSGLFLLVDRLLSHFGPENLTYFPSFELVMDELRDYRFYASDMLHLSETATTFVQEKFNEVFLDSESKEISFSVDKIIKSLDHKPFNTCNPVYQEMLSRLLEEAEKMVSKYPGIDLNDLINNIVQKKEL
jgi:hypothetical protein